MKKFTCVCVVLLFSVSSFSFAQEDEDFLSHFKSYFKAKGDRSLLELVDNSYLPVHKKKEFLTLLFKLLTNRQYFTKSFEYKNYKKTLNQFFKEPIYEKLTGNLFLGYVFVEKGFNFRGKSFRIDRLISLKNIDRKYLSLFREKFYYILKKFGYKVTKQGEHSDFSIGLCIVSVYDKDDKISQKGLTYEFYLKNNTANKGFFLRTSTGSKEGLNHAVDVSIRRIIVYLNSLKTDKKKNVKTGK